MDTALNFLRLFAVLIMGYAFYRANVLRKRVPGGIVKYSLNLLSELIALFTMSYIVILILPEFTYVPQGLITAVTFFIVSIFVVIVIDLFHMVVSEIGL